MQAEAIAHIRGPAFIIAGPGSGKTFVIIQRIISLISKHHVKPDRILVLTFSKAAANEMKTRYEKSLDIEGVNFGTFHAVAYGILRNHMGFRDLKLISDQQKVSAVKVLVENTGIISECDRDLAYEILGLISKHKCDPDREMTYSIPQCVLSDECLKNIVFEYENFLKDEKLIDFDDMMTECVRQLENDEYTLESLRNRFEYIIIDEFQDINEQQYRLVKLLEGEEKNVMAVGDDDQSIYAFRGSSPGYIRKFIDDHEDTGLFYLTENYRSCERIVKASSKVIEKNKDRMGKEFVAVKEGGDVSFSLFEQRRDEEKYMVSMIRKIRELSNVDEDIAIIVRTNAEVLLYDMMLKNNGIDTVNSGTEKKKHDRSYIFDDMCAFLSFIENGHKRSDLIRFMNKPMRYIQRDALLNETVSKEDLLNYYANNPNMTKNISEFWKRIELSSKLDIRGRIDILRRALGYDEYIREKSVTNAEYEISLKTADEIQQILSDTKQRGRYFAPPDESVIKDYFKTVKKKESLKQKSHGIFVMTMHMAKGLEFDNVILPDLNDGVMPKKNISEKETEEERRLLYVAMTRAKKRLFLLATEERNRKISSFIRDLINDDQIISSNSASSRNS